MLSLPFFASEKSLQKIQQLLLDIVDTGNRSRLTTGQNPEMPAARVRCFQVEQRGDRLHIELPSDPDD